MQVAPGIDFVDPMPGSNYESDVASRLWQVAPGRELGSSASTDECNIRGITETKLRGALAGDKKSAHGPEAQVAARFNRGLGRTPPIVGIHVCDFCSGRCHPADLVRKHFKFVACTLKCTRTRGHRPLGLRRKPVQIALHLLAEGLLLSILGAAFGLLMSQAISPLLLRMASERDDVVHLDTAIDWRVLLFTGSVAVATALICSLVASLKGLTGSAGQYAP